ncbi:MAG: hypothetical protein JAZ17_20765 [Candidatus Thiodiazotropha endolucinida]|nr:hypothetical protein [Candidatus Thiodiazotropha endolucinida]
MIKVMGFILAIIILFAIFSGNDDKPKTAGSSSKPTATVAKIPPSACDASTVITGKKYSVLGSGINVRKGPGTGYDKIINQKATSMLKTTKYISIDDTTTIYEECTKDGWSWIRVVDPDWLQNSHSGWVVSKFIDKGQDIGGGKYTRKISSSALSPYTIQGYPTTIKKYGTRIGEIETLRRKAAEMAVDSGKCDYVLMTELSDSKSSLNHLHFWVDCKNKQRIYLDEFQINKGAAVLTQQEKSWDKQSALIACQKAIKDRALIPSEVDIHTILGTSFYKAPVTHNVVLNMDFDAKNALGVGIPYTAKCHFAPGEVGNIEILSRK